jgi:hypothetical protein
MNKKGGISMIQLGDLNKITGGDRPQFPKKNI